MYHGHIAFEHITQTHLLILGEYIKKNQSLVTQARNCNLKLPIYKRELLIAMGLAGEIPFGVLTKAQVRARVEHFFARWYTENHTPAPELQSATPIEAPPRFRACNTIIVHDPAISSRQMECLRQYITQHNIVRAAEAMKLNKGKYKNELARALYRAAVVCKRRNPMAIMSHPKSTLVALVHEYFETLENTPTVTMDDPLF